MNKIRKIIGKVIRGLSFFWEFVVLRNIYDMSYRLNSPKLSALILVLLTKRLNGKKKYRVLCLGRSQFKDDINALIDFGNNIQYLYFHKLLLGKIVRYLISFSLDKSLLSLSYSEVANINFDDGCTYHIDPKYETGKEKVYNYISSMFGILQKWLKFDAVISGSFIYVDQQEFFKICMERNIPAIVLFKEGFWIALFPDDSLIKEETNWFRFIGTKMLVVNEAVNKDYVRNISGVDENKVITVGIPRLDYYFKNTKRYLKQIVLFSFEPQLLYPFPFRIQNPSDKNKIEEISENFHKNVMRFALKHPDYKVVIKTKSNNTYAQNVYFKYFDSKKILNIEITQTAKAGNLILDSQVILGFFSTVLLEAIIAEKIIITPFFGNVIMDKKWDFFADYPDFVNYANTHEKLESMILNYEDYTLPSWERKKQFLEPLILKADGNASIRAEQAIINTIEEYKDKNSNER